MIYYFEVHTADQVYAGTDSNIFVKLYGERGVSIERRLNGNISGNAFERNKTDIFQVEYDQDCGEIYRIDLRSDNRYAGNAWLCDYIKISRKPFDGKNNSYSKFVFKTGEWVNSTKVYVLDAAEGYHYQVKNTGIKMTELDGEIIHMPPESNVTISAHTEVAVHLDYSKVETTSVETNVSTEVSADVLKMVFSTKINYTLEEMYSIKMDTINVTDLKIEVQPSAKKRNLRVKWAQEDYSFDVQMGTLDFRFALPKRRVFSGLVDDDTHEDVPVVVREEMYAVLDGDDTQ